MVGRMGPGMRHIVGFWDRSTGMGNFGVNVECPMECTQWEVCNIPHSCAKVHGTVMCM